MSSCLGTSHESSRGNSSQLCPLTAYPATGPTTRKISESKGLFLQFSILVSPETGIHLH